MKVIVEVIGIGGKIKRGEIRLLNFLFDVTLSDLRRSNGWSSLFLWKA